MNIRIALLAPLLVYHVRRAFAPMNSLFRALAGSVGSYRDGDFAVGLSWLTGQHWVTLVLSTSPGGIAEMSITAKVLQLGVPVVTAFQVCRLVAVLLLVAPMYHRLYGSKTA